ncbi:MAG: fumarylacetoacetate hydrolase, partial [Acidimicrobiales bacterium]
MKIANIDNRAVVIVDGTVVDVANASDDRFGPDPMDLYEHWDEFTAWARDIGTGIDALDESKLRCPVPRPRQVFAIGLNYRTHAEESGMAVPDVPATFTKFPASLSGPFDD